MESSDPVDTWRMVHDKKVDNLFILGCKSGLSEPSRKDIHSKYDAVLPFFTVELKAHTTAWQRLACLPEALGQKTLQLCVGNGQATEGTTKHEAD
jgi:hypothetical protein